MQYAAYLATIVETSRVAGLSEGQKPPQLSLEDLSTVLSSWFSSTLD